jgi:hypothetical protein
MRPHAALAALVLAPLVAAAEPPTPPAPDAGPHAAEWSFGAGLSFGLLFSSTPPSFISSSSPISSNAGVPTVNASLERRLSPRNWLVFGAAGAAERRRSDVPADAIGFTRDDWRSLYLTAGLRRVLTRASAPVDVSLLVLAGAGVAEADQHFLFTGAETRADVSSWLAGADAGIAVDRELTGGLSLRVASPLLGVTYARDRIEEAGQPRRTATAFSARAILAPRLELRLAF